MQKELRFLISALVVGFFAFAMFSAAGFFYSNLQEIGRTCAYYNIGRRECYSGDSVRMSVAAYQVGIALFSATGVASWAIAALLGLKWKQVRSSSRLP